MNNMKLSNVIMCRILFIILLTLFTGLIINFNKMNKFDIKLEDTYSFNITCLQKPYILKGYLTDMTHKVDDNTKHINISLILIWVFLCCKLLNDKINYNIERKKLYLQNIIITQNNILNTNMYNKSHINTVFQTFSFTFLIVILIFHIISFILINRIQIASDVWIIDCSGNSVPFCC